MGNIIHHNVSDVPDRSSYFTSCLAQNIFVINLLRTHLFNKLLLSHRNIFHLSQQNNNITSTKQRDNTVRRLYLILCDKGTSREPKPPLIYKILIESKVHCTPPFYTLGRFWPIFSFQNWRNFLGNNKNQDEPGDPSERNVSAPVQETDLDGEERCVSPEAFLYKIVRLLGPNVVEDQCCECGFAVIYPDFSMDTTTTSVPSTSSVGVQYGEGLESLDEYQVALDFAEKHGYGSVEFVDTPLEQNSSSKLWKNARSYTQIGNEFMLRGEERRFSINYRSRNKDVGLQNRRKCPRQPDEPGPAHLEYEFERERDVVRGIADTISGMEFSTPEMTSVHRRPTKFRRRKSRKSRHNKTGTMNAADDSQKPMAYTEYNRFICNKDFEFGSFSHYKKRVIEMCRKISSFEVNSTEEGATKVGTFENTNDTKKTKTNKSHADEKNCQKKNDIGNNNNHSPTGVHRTEEEINDVITAQVYPTDLETESMAKTSKRSNYSHVEQSEPNTKIGLSHEKNNQLSNIVKREIIEKVCYKPVFDDKEGHKERGTSSDGSIEHETQYMRCESEVQEDIKEDCEDCEDNEIEKEAERGNVAVKNFDAIGRCIPMSAHRAIDLENNGLASRMMRLSVGRRGVVSCSNLASDSKFYEFYSIASIRQGIVAGDSTLRQTSPEKPIISMPTTNASAHGDCIVSEDDKDDHSTKPKDAGSESSQVNRDTGVNIKDYKHPDSLCLTNQGEILTREKTKREEITPCTDPAITESTCTGNTQETPYVEKALNTEDSKSLRKDKSMKGNDDLAMDTPFVVRDCSIPAELDSLGVRGVPKDEDQDEGKEEYNANGGVESDRNNNNDVDDSSNNGVDDIEHNSSHLDDGIRQIGQQNAPEASRSNIDSISSELEKELVCLVQDKRARNKTTNSRQCEYCNDIQTWSNHCPGFSDQNSSKTISNNRRVIGSGCSPSGRTFVPSTSSATRCYYPSFPEQTNQTSTACSGNRLPNDSHPDNVAADSPGQITRFPSQNEHTQPTNCEMTEMPPTCLPLNRFQRGVVYCPTTENYWDTSTVPTLTNTSTMPYGTDLTPHLPTIPSVGQQQQEPSEMSLDVIEDGMGTQDINDIADYYRLINSSLSQAEDILSERLDNLNETVSNRLASIEKLAKNRFKRTRRMIGKLKEELVSETKGNKRDGGESAPHAIHLNTEAATGACSVKWFDEGQTSRDLSEPTKKRKAFPCIKFKEVTSNNNKDKFESTPSQDAKCHTTSCKLRQVKSECNHCMDHTKHLAKEMTSSGNAAIALQCTGRQRRGGGKQTLPGKIETRSCKRLNRLKPPCKNASKSRILVQYRPHVHSRRCRLRRFLRGEEENCARCVKKLNSIRYSKRSPLPRRCSSMLRRKTRSQSRRPTSSKTRRTQSVRKAPTKKGSRRRRVTSKRKISQRPRMAPKKIRTPQIRGIVCTKKRSQIKSRPKINKRRNTNCNRGQTQNCATNMKQQKWCVVFQDKSNSSNKRRRIVKGKTYELRSMCSLNDQCHQSDGQTYCITTFGYRELCSRLKEKNERLLKELRSIKHIDSALNVTHMKKHVADRFNQLVSHSSGAKVKRLFRILCVDGEQSSAHHSNADLLISKPPGRINTLCEANEENNNKDDHRNMMFKQISNSSPIKSAYKSINIENRSRFLQHVDSLSLMRQKDTYIPKINAPYYFNDFTWSSTCQGASSNSSVSSCSHCEYEKAFGMRCSCVQATNNDCKRSVEGNAVGSSGFVRTDSPTHTIDSGSNATRNSIHCPTLIADNTSDHTIKRVCTMCSRSVDCQSMPQTSSMSFPHFHTQHSGHLQSYSLDKDEGSISTFKWSNPEVIHQSKVNGSLNQDGYFKGTSEKYKDSSEFDNTKEDNSFTKEGGSINSKNISLPTTENKNVAIPGIENSVSEKDNQFCLRSLPTLVLRHPIKCDENEPPLPTNRNQSRNVPINVAFETFGQNPQTTKLDLSNAFPEEPIGTNTSSINSDKEQNIPLDIGADAGLQCIENHRDVKSHDSPCLSMTSNSIQTPLVCSRDNIIELKETCCNETSQVENVLKNPKSSGGTQPISNAGNSMNDTNESTKESWENIVRLCLEYVGTEATNEASNELLSNEHCSSCDDVMMHEMSPSIDCPNKNLNFTLVSNQTGCFPREDIEYHVIDLTRTDNESISRSQLSMESGDASITGENDERDNILETKNTGKLLNDHEHSIDNDIEDISMLCEPGIDISKSDDELLCDEETNEPIRGQQEFSLTNNSRPARTVSTKVFGNYKESVNIGAVDGALATMDAALVSSGTDPTDQYIIDRVHSTAATSTVRTVSAISESVFFKRCDENDVRPVKSTESSVNSMESNEYITEPIQSDERNANPEGHNEIDKTAVNDTRTETIFRVPTDVTRLESNTGDVICNKLFSEPVDVLITLRVDEGISTNALVHRNESVPGVETFAPGEPLNDVSIPCEHESVEVGVDAMIKPRDETECVDDESYHTDTNTENISSEADDDQCRVTEANEVNIAECFLNSNAIIVEELPLFSNVVPSIGNPTGEDRDTHVVTEIEHIDLNLRPYTDDCSRDCTDNGIAIGDPILSDTIDSCSLENHVIDCDTLSLAVNNRPYNAPSIEGNDALSNAGPLTENVISINPVSLEDHSNSLRPVNLEYTETLFSPISLEEPNTSHSPVSLEDHVSPPNAVCLENNDAHYNSVPLIDHATPCINVSLEHANAIENPIPLLEHEARHGTFSIEEDDLPHDIVSLEDNEILCNVISLEDNHTLHNAISLEDQDTLQNSVILEEHNSPQTPVSLGDYDNSRVTLSLPKHDASHIPVLFGGHDTLRDTLEGPAISDTTLSLTMDNENNQSRNSIPTLPYFNVNTPGVSTRWTITMLSPPKPDCLRENPISDSECAQSPNADADTLNADNNDYSGIENTYRVSGNNSSPGDSSSTSSSDTIDTERPSDPIDPDNQPRSPPDISPTTSETNNNNATQILTNVLFSGKRESPSLQSSRLYNTINNTTTASTSTRAISLDKSRSCDGIDASLTFCSSNNVNRTQRGIFKTEEGGSSIRTDDDVARCDPIGLSGSCTRKWKRKISSHSDDSSSRPRKVQRVNHPLDLSQFLACRRSKKILQRARWQFLRETRFARSRKARRHQRSNFAVHNNPFPPVDGPSSDADSETSVK